MVFVEETIAGRATGNTAPHKGLLRRQAQVLGGSACRDDECIAGVLSASVSGEAIGACGKIDARDVVVYHFSIKAFGMRGKALHQFGSLDPVGIRRPVIHFCGGHQLTALGETCDHDGVEVGASSIDCGGVACRSRPENENFGMFWR